MQAVQTNVIGTDNVLHAAIDAGVKRVVCLSTDKAAYPINAMGISKAMMEHVIYANAVLQLSVEVQQFAVLVMEMLCAVAAALFRFLLIRLKLVTQLQLQTRI